MWVMGNDAKFQYVPIIIFVGIFCFLSSTLPILQLMMMMMAIDDRHHSPLCVSVCVCDRKIFRKLCGTHWVKSLYFIAPSSTTKQLP